MAFGGSSAMNDTTTAAEPEVSTRSGIVALVGRANVGKSTLLNCMLGEKVSIVSRVAQTTRNLVRTMLTEARGQLVLLDTPGVHRARHELGRLMNRTARKAASAIDVAMLVLDGSSRVRQEDRGWMRRLIGTDVPCVAVLNKADLGRAHEAGYRAAWGEAAKALDVAREPAGWHAVSGLNGRGVPALLNALFGLVPPGPLLFPEDVLTDFPRKLLIADLIREKLFGVLEQELPHAIAVWVDELEEAGQNWEVAATVCVDKSSQKGIVVGHKGRVLRRVRRAAEAEISALYEKQVRLALWVKVERHWARKHWILKRLGYGS